MAQHAGLLKQFSNSVFDKALKTCSLMPVLSAKTYPKQVKIVEVGPRDGLQNEKTFVPTKTKIELIDRLSETGLSVVEATSFVNPKAIPQMADATEVLASISKADGVSYPVLVPNMRGMEKAVESGVKEIAVFAAASEAFSKKNINCTIEESLQRFEAVMKTARENDVKVRGYVSCVATCPYSKENSDPAIVNEVAQAMLDLGCYEISLGDTTGHAQIEQTATMINALKQADKSIYAAHFHDTFARAVPNTIVALSEGIAVVDSSVAGLGGCPYAPGASGNVPTEDIVYLCELFGIKHGVDLVKLIQVGDWISKEIGRENKSNVRMEDLHADLIAARQYEISQCYALGRKDAFRD